MRAARLASYARAAVVAAAILATCAGAARGADYLLVIEAQPQRLAAGADQPCAITVRATDTTGAPAPDGTEVTFVTTLGHIDPQRALTAGGLARAELKSPTPGRAEVSILVGNQHEMVMVEFSSRGPAAAAAPKPPPMVRIDGGYVAYSADYDCITATDKARARHGHLVVEAGNIQYEVTRGVLKAQHDVRVHSGAAELEGDRACYSVPTCDGVLLRTENGVERISFRGEDLQPSSSAVASGASFLPTDTSDTTTWIVARDATVFPNDRIQFSSATLYVGDRRIFSLPYYVAPLRGQRSLLNQMFSISSSGGLNLDLPFYYSANQTHAGSLHLRHRAGGTYGYGRPGWSLGLEERYRLGAGSAGTVAIDDLTESTRSMRIDHQIEFAPLTRLNMGVNYYRYNPSYPGALTARALYSSRLSHADLNVMALASSIGGTSSWSVDGSMRWNDRPIAHSGFNYDVVSSLGYGSSQYGYGGGVLASAGFGLGPPDWEIAKSTSAGLDLFQQYTWAQIGGSRTNFSARALLRQGLGALGTANLSYNLDISRGGFYSTYGRQQINLNAYLGQAPLWRAAGYISYSLDRASTFASGSVSYRLPIEKKSSGTSPWRLDLRGSYAQFGTANSMSSRVAIGRALGDYEVLMCYSPTANYGYGSYGYGYGRGKSFWIEFGALGM
jgi:hypothetical protein